jgi:inositol hexakisphosphate/diphosphoinositol-pentakisphosphate kinase
LDFFTQVREVLERWQLSGINRKVQLKPVEWRETTAADGECMSGSSSGSDLAEDPSNPARPRRRHTRRGTASAGTGPVAVGWKRIDLNRRVTKLTLILKWGGDLTKVGEKQAEALGASFRRTHYPGSTDGSDGLLRLHSTFRHDLKIYTSDEGRVQMTAAAFTKGLLELQGELTPILVSLIDHEKTAHAMLDHSGHTEAEPVVDRVKQRMKGMILRKERGGGGDGTGEAKKDKKDKAEKRDKAEKKEKKEKREKQEWQDKEVEESGDGDINPTQSISIARALRSMEPGGTDGTLDELLCALTELNHILQQVLLRSYAAEDTGGTEKRCEVGALSGSDHDEQVVADEFEPANRESLAQAFERWSKLQSSLYKAKKKKFDLSKVIAECFLCTSLTLRCCADS